MKLFLELLSHVHSIWRVINQLLSRAYLELQATRMAFHIPGKHPWTLATQSLSKLPDLLRFEEIRPMSEY